MCACFIYFLCCDIYTFLPSILDLIFVRFSLKAECNIHIFTLQCELCVFLPTLFTHFFTFETRRARLHIFTLND